MGISRVHSVALVAAVVLTASTVATTSAEASVRRTAPTASVRQVDATTVAVSGRTATRHPRVKFEKRTPSGWVFVKRVRAHAHRYATTLSIASGTSLTFRATSNHRSRKFVVTTAARTTAPVTKKPAPPTLSDDCGVRPRKADGSAWSCTFDDEFDGTTLDRTKWVPQRTYTGTADLYACFRDDPSNVNVANGVLSLTLIKLAAPAKCPFGLADTTLMSGGVSTYHLFSQQYGRYEARIKNTASDAPGLHEAFWMWPDDRDAPINWPTTGEIDVAETYSNHNTYAIPFFHYAADFTGMLFGVNTNACTAYRGVWNTYTLEWSPNRLEVFVNGQSCLVNTSGDAAFQKRYIINLTQGIGPAPAGNSPVDGTTYPASMQVDYVRVWQ
jgi:beta-glucanase (GH16 family)